MPKIPFDIDKEFGREKTEPIRESAAGRIARGGARVLFAIGSLALGWALLRDSGLF